MHAADSVGAVLSSVASAYATSTLMARKANEHAEHQGEAALSLLEEAAKLAEQLAASSANGVDVYA